MRAYGLNLGLAFQLFDDVLADRVGRGAVQGNGRPRCGKERREIHTEHGLRNERGRDCEHADERSTLLQRTSVTIHYGPK